MKLAIRPERVHIEPYESSGPNRVPAMVERLVFLGSSTQVIMRLAHGERLQALIQNQGGPSGLPTGHRGAGLPARRRAAGAPLGTPPRDGGPAAGRE